MNNNIIKRIGIGMIAVLLLASMCACSKNAGNVSGKVEAKEVQDLDALIGKTRTEADKQFETWGLTSEALSIPDASEYEACKIVPHLYDHDFTTEVEFEKASGKCVGYSAYSMIGSEMTDEDWESVYSILQYYVGLYGDPVYTDLEGMDSAASIKAQLENTSGGTVRWGSSTDVTDAGEQEITGLPASVSVMMELDDDDNATWMINIDNWSGLIE